MLLLNCTRETKLATIFHIIPTKGGKPLTKSYNITIEQIDKIPEIAKALVIYNNESLKKEAREEAMKFISERVQKFLYKAIYIESNAIDVGVMLGLPSYEEMDEIIEKQLQKI